MTEFKVTGKAYRLKHSDITPGFEHHHCEWSARERIADNEFRDDIQTDLLVRDSRNDTDWNCVDEC